jgi:plastocyanin
MMAKHGLLALLLLLVSAVAMAEVPVFELVIENNRFQPATLEVPAGQKVKLRVMNRDPAPEEFESYDLNREKIVTGNSEILIYVGPLDAGEYSFYGEFHQETAQGKLVAK